MPDNKPNVDDIIELREHYDEGTPMRRLCDFVIALGIEVLTPITEATDNGDED